MSTTSVSVRQRAASIVMLAATIAAIGVPTPPRAEAVDPTPADTVIEWNDHAQIAIIATAGQGPTVAYLHLAMVQGAVYDAVNAIVGGYEPYLGSPAIADPGDSAPAAAAQAAHDVLAALFPLQAATLDAKLAISLAAISDAGKTGGIEVGAAAADAMIAARTGDGRFPSTPFTVIQGTQP